MAAANQIDMQRFTWWRSKDKRLFVVLERIIEPVEGEPGKWKTSRITLLELLSSEILVRPFQEICELIEEGLMNPVPEDVKLKYLNDKILL